MKVGYLAKEFGGVRLQLQVLQSGAGFYLGTVQDNQPYSRESTEYWETEDQATAALSSGEFTQKESP